MPKAEVPLSGKIQRFIEHFLDCRDIPRASLLTGIDPEEGKRLYRNKEIRAIIEARIEVENLTAAKLRAKARVLTEDSLDIALLKLLSGKEAGAVKVKAIELGYKRHGMLKEKVEHSGEGGGPLTFELAILGRANAAS